MPAELGRNFSFGEEADSFFFFKFGVLSCCLCYYIYASWRQRSCYLYWEAYICNNTFQKISNRVFYLPNLCIHVGIQLREHGLILFFFFAGEGGEMVIVLSLCMTCDVCLLFTFWGE